MEELNKLNELISKRERELDVLYEQRRELINYLNLNKGKNNEQQSISKRGNIEQ